MSTTQSKLPTPTRSPSLPSTRGSSPDPDEDFNGEPTSQRLPPPVEETLPRYGIPIEKADRWILEYNRESLPIMHDDQFRQLLIDTSRDTDPADPAFELKVKSIVEEESALSREKWSDTFYKLFLAGPDLFPNNNLKALCFVSALSSQRTVLGLGTFIAECLPEMVEELQKRRSEAAPKTKTPKAKRVLKSNAQRVSKSSGESNGGSGRRRSPTIQKLHTPSESNPSSSDPS